MFVIALHHHDDKDAHGEVGASEGDARLGINRLTKDDSINI